MRRKLEDDVSYPFNVNGTREVSVQCVRLAMSYDDGLLLKRGPNVPHHATLVVPLHLRAAATVKETRVISHILKCTGHSQRTSMRILDQAFFGGETILLP